MDNQPEKYMVHTYEVYTDSSVDSIIAPILVL